jgi:hypothetical protein
VAWPEVASSQGSASLEGGRREQLRRALAAFECCQRWSMCEVSPGKPA